MRERGFTIIELMIVMTIIGILSALAIPMYQSYLTRSKVTEAFTLAKPVQIAVAEAYVGLGAFPADNAAANFGAPATLGGRYVRSIGIVEGVVTITFGDPTLSGQTVTLTPTAGATTVTWSCATSLPDSLRPRNC